MRALRTAVAAAALALALPTLDGCRGKSAPTGNCDPAVLAATIDAAAAPKAAATADAGESPADVALPGSPGPDLDARLRHLLEAIGQDNPDLAADLLFPRDAYLAMKDVSDPASHWEKRVSGRFRRSISRMHKRVKGAEQAKLVSFELGRSVVQITPKKKDWKRPLWRVSHSKVTFTIEDKTHHVDIAEMIAWRGAWYITRLR